jgi:hypothetical protein
MSENEGQELDLTPVEGEKPVPVGFRMLFWGLIAFGAYYLWKYSPAFTGWTQSGDLDEPASGAGINVFATVVFTALAVIVAVSIVLAMARRKPGAGSARAGPSTGSGRARA